MRAFATKDGYVGSGPCLMKPGDIVCIVQGSNIPILLRKEGSHPIHVGPCFVPDLMDGEIAQAAFAGLRELDVEEFEIH